MSYDIENEAYSYVGDQFSLGGEFRCITSSKEKLYLFSRNQIFEMTEQGEALDTININDTVKGEFYFSKYTNTDGMIFLLTAYGRV